MEEEETYEKYKKVRNLRERIMRKRGGREDVKIVKDYRRDAGQEK